jgi:ABC-type uncharacterized transport system auxiliary subunit
VDRLLAALVLAASVLAGCSPSIEANRAADIAQALVVAGQPSGSIVHDITVAPPEWQTNHWRVQVDATVTNRQPTGGTVEVPVHYLIDVDGNSGKASIYAQG